MNTLMGGEKGYVASSHDDQSPFSAPDPSRQPAFAESYGGHEMPLPPVRDGAGGDRIACPPQSRLPKDGNHIRAFRNHSDVAVLVGLCAFKDGFLDGGDRVDEDIR